jgi:hypothetical protein
MNAIFAALGQLLVAASKSDWTTAVAAAVALFEAVVSAFPNHAKGLVTQALANHLKAKEFTSQEAPVIGVVGIDNGSFFE